MCAYFWYSDLMFYTHLVLRFSSFYPFGLSPNCRGNHDVCGVRACCADDKLYGGDGLVLGASYPLLLMLKPQWLLQFTFFCDKTTILDSKSTIFADKTFFLMVEQRYLMVNPQFWYENDIFFFKQQFFMVKQPFLIRKKHFGIGNTSFFWWEKTTILPSGRLT